MHNAKNPSLPWLVVSEAAAAFAVNAGIDLTAYFFGSVAEKKELRKALPKVPSIYQPSGKLPLSAFRAMTLGILVSVPVGLAAGHLLGLVSCLSYRLFTSGMEIRLRDALHGLRHPRELTLLALLGLILALSGYLVMPVVGLVAARLMKPFSRLVKNRSPGGAAIFVVGSAVISMALAWSLFQAYGREWFDWGFHATPGDFDTAYLVIALLGAPVPMIVGGVVAYGWIRKEKFCEDCDTYMQQEALPSLQLGGSLALAKAMTKKNLRAAADLLFCTPTPASEMGKATLFSCPHCGNGFLELNVHFKANEETTSWLAASIELSEGQVNRFKPLVVGATGKSEIKSHFELGVALQVQGDLEGALAAYRQALDYDPKDAQTHYNLGNAFQAKGDLVGAVAAWRTALDCAPKFALAHYNLGLAFQAKGDLAGALAAWRKALDCAPKLAEAHCNLGHILRMQGQFSAALEALRRGHELGWLRWEWPYPSAQWVQEAERLVALEAELPAFLDGNAKPANVGDALTLADICQIKKRYAAAVRFYADAFTADPNVADDPQAGHRYNAACYAALAAAGQGEDAANLVESERGRLRQQARAWLHADLASWTKQLASGQSDDRKTVQQQLRHWQTDGDLASIRDAVALAALPADERAAWQQLWADVAALLKKAEAAK